MIRNPQKWITGTGDCAPDESHHGEGVWIPQGFRRVTAWEPFATGMAYWGLSGVSIGEAAIGTVGSVIIWRCVVEPVEGAP